MIKLLTFVLLIFLSTHVQCAELGYSSSSSAGDVKYIDYPADPTKSYTFATLLGTMPEDGDITSIKMWLKDDTTQAIENTHHVALYADNGSNFPSTRLATSGTTHRTTSGTYAIFTFPISYSASAGEKLWCGIDAISDDTTFAGYSYVKTTSTTPTITSWLVLGRSTPNNLKDPFPTSPTPSSRDYAINAWIEYTPTAAPSTTKILTITGD